MTQKTNDSYDKVQGNRKDVKKNSNLKYKFRNSEMN